MKVQAQHVIPKEQVLHFKDERGADIEAEIAHVHSYGGSTVIWCFDADNVVLNPETYAEDEEVEVSWA